MSEPVRGSAGPSGGRLAAIVRRHPSIRIVAVFLLAVVVLVVLSKKVPTPLGPGLTVLAVAIGLGFVLVLVSSPVAAVLVVLLTSFFRVAVPISGLPAEPAVLAVVGLFGSVVLAVMRRTRRAPRLHAVELAMVLFLLWNVGSAIAPHALPNFDPTTGTAIRLDRFILVGVVVPFLMFVMGRWLFTERREIRRALWSIVAFGGFSVVVSVLQTSGIPAIEWPTFPAASTWADRAVGVFNQPVVNGLVLVLVFMVALYLAARTEMRLATRIALYVLAASCIIGIYLTLTRIVWLVFVIVLVAGALTARGFRTGFVVPLSLLPVVVIAEWNTLTSPDRFTGGVTSTSEIDDRLNVMATALWAIGQKPLFGWGLGRFILVNTYYHQQFSQNVDWQRGYGFVSHQNELGITAELGVLGLLLWLAVLFLIVRGLRRAWRVVRGHGGEAEGIVLLGCLTMGIWWVTGLTVDLRYFDFAGAVVMLLVGMATGVGDRIAAESPGPGRGGRTRSRPVPPRTGSHRVAPTASPAVTAAPDERGDRTPAPGRTRAPVGAGAR